MTTLDRKENTLYWIFSKNGIESKVYKAVMNKKSYTNDTFKKDYNIKEVKKINKNARYNV